MLIAFALLLTMQTTTATATLDRSGRFVDPDLEAERSAGAARDRRVRGSTVLIGEPDGSYYVKGYYASPPSGDAMATEHRQLTASQVEQIRDGARKYGFGSALVVTGSLALLGSAGLAFVLAENHGKVEHAAIPAGGGLLFAAIGALLISQGSDLFEAAAR